MGTVIFVVVHFGIRQLPGPLALHISCSVCRGLAIALVMEHCFCLAIILKLGSYHIMAGKMWACSKLNKSSYLYNYGTLATIYIVSYPYSYGAFVLLLLLIGENNAQNSLPPCLLLVVLACKNSIVF